MRFCGFGLFLKHTAYKNNANFSYVQLCASGGIDFSHINLWRTAIDVLEIAVKRI